MKIFRLICILASVGLILTEGFQAPATCFGICLTLYMTVVVT